MSQYKYAIVYRYSHSWEEPAGNGRGVDSYSESHDKIEKFESESELTKWIKNNPHRNYEVIRYQEMTVEKEVKLSLSTK